MATLSKKLSNLHTKNFLIGFEVECLIYRRPTTFHDNYQSYENGDTHTNALTYQEITSKINAINPKIVIGSDGSVHGNGRYSTFNFEFKTPPLPPVEAFEVLDKMFAVINEHGYTNRTCGLHVNFSPMSAKVYKSLDPLKLLNNKLWKEIKTAFKRTGNSYCYTSPYNNQGKPFKRKGIKKKKPKVKTPLDIFSDWFQSGDDCYDYSGSYNNANDPTLPDHYKRVDPTKAYDCGHGCEVSLDNYGSERHAESRIEIRCFGNTDYHKKYDLIAQFTNKIFSLYKRCCSVKF